MKLAATVAVAILLAWATPSQAESAQTVTAAACSPDADLSGMLDAMQELQERSTGLDAELVKDAARVIDGYRREREVLCGRISAHAEMITALTEGLRLKADALQIEVQNRDAYRTAYEAALKRPGIRNRWFGCGAGPHLGIASTGDTVSSVGIGCILIMWP